jgi:hypothetical protein
MFVSVLSIFDMALTSSVFLRLLSITLQGVCYLGYGECSIGEDICMFVLEEGQLANLLGATQPP